MAEITYGRRKEDIMPEDITKDVANLTDSQKINIKILQAITSLNTVVNDLQHNVDVHDKLLITGNGEPSIQERLRVLEGYIAGMKYWSRFIGGTILIQTVTFGIAVVWTIIRVLPILEKLATNP